MRNLNREPLLRDVPVPGGRVLAMWQGELNAAGVGIEVSEVALDQSPTPTRLRQVWSARRAGGARPVLVFASAGPGQVLICGPDGAPPPVALLGIDLAERIFDIVLDQLPVPATRHAIDLINRAQGSGEVPGFRNRSLVSTHYVTQVIRRELRPEWTEAAGQGGAAIGKAGEALIRALGYDLEVTGPKEYRVQDAGAAVALAHVYEEGVSLDRVGQGQAAPPSTIALQSARKFGLDHALLVAGPLLRIYSLKAEETLDEGAASAAFVEFDTTLLPAAWAPLLGALAAPDALRENGRLERIRAGSGRYAVALRERFTKRLYEEVVDRLVRGIDTAAKDARVDPRPDETELYRATLVLLFRLLFLLYAEDRDLLPMVNAEYAANSITRKVLSAAETLGTPGRHFDDRATSVWTGLGQLFQAVAKGNADWGVPPYDGGLFADEGLDDGLLARIALPNAVIGPALVALGWDETPTGEAGKIDFGDLGVRHIGTIYEGLLSYEVAFATENLRIDRRVAGEPYVPAAQDETPDVPVGAPHIRSPQGGRKATGSYYTPVFAVDRLIDKTLRPGLDEHLGRVGDDLDLPSQALFDFRVADIAMGSGHFLVAALDALTERYGAYLAAHPNRAVRAELEAARDRLNTVGLAYGAPQLGDRIADVDLLRRIVLKRCIYGVDLNEMAVELARLGLWLHSLVPGLPLSYLGANLQHGNSLVGVAGVDAGTGVFGARYEAEAAAKAGEVASITDLELGDIVRGQQLLAELEQATRGLSAYYDVLTAGPLLDRDLAALEIEAQSIIEGRVSGRVATELTAATEAATGQGALHWRLAFPAVFLRPDRPGFDVIVGNPPWEEVTVERLGFFVRHLPGLKAIKSQVEQERRIAAFEAAYPTVRERYEAEMAAKSALRRYLGAKYVLTRSGDPDLYKAFAERFLGLVREGGRLGVVLPRSAFAGDGTAPFRERLFGSTRQASLDVILNNRQWMFPAVHPQYTIVLLAAEIGPAAERAIDVSTVIDDRPGFDLVDEERTAWTLEQLRRPHPDLAIPLLPSGAAARLYQRVVSAHSRFDSARGGWRAVPWAELHGTNDRKSGLLKEPGATRGDAWPVYGGRSFDLWEPELWRRPGGELSFVLEPEVGLRELQRKRQRSDVWRGNFPVAVLRDPETLPHHRPRILFRDITNRTNSRTTIACLVPPGVFAHNKAPSLLWPAGDERDMAYLLGVMASVPFDWFARRRVEVNMNYFILNSLPVPRPPRADQRWQRVVELAGRLASVDERYAGFARAVGVDHGPLDASTKAAGIAELDAIVAHLYGFTREELEFAFEDFPLTEAGVPPGRRTAGLEHYARWTS